MLNQISETILELGFYKMFIDHIILTSSKGDYSCILVYIEASNEPWIDLLLLCWIVSRDLFITSCLVYT